MAKQKSKTKWPTVIKMPWHELSSLLVTIDAYLDMPDLYSRKEARKALKEIMEQVDPAYANDCMSEV